MCINGRACHTYTRCKHRPDGTHQSITSDHRDIFVYWRDYWRVQSWNIEYVNTSPVPHECTLEPQLQITPISPIINPLLQLRPLNWGWEELASLWVEILRLRITSVQYMEVSYESVKEERRLSMYGLSSKDYSDTAAGCCVLEKPPLWCPVTPSEGRSGGGIMIWAVDITQQSHSTQPSDGKDAGGCKEDI